MNCFVPRRTNDAVRGILAVLLIAGIAVSLGACGDGELSYSDCKFPALVDASDKAECQQIVLKAQTERANEAWGEQRQAVKDICERVPGHEICDPEKPSPPTPLEERLHRHQQELRELVARCLAEPDRQKRVEIFGSSTCR
jgi:hypothetical protein